MAKLVSDAIQYARQKAQTDSNGITDTNGLAWANMGLIDITRDLIERGVDAAQTQEAYATSLGSDNPAGQLAWPTDMWMLKTIEVDYTNTGGQNFIQAKVLDVSNLQFQTSWDFLRKLQTTSQPYFTNHGDTMEIFPTPVTGSPCLVRIFYYLSPTEYSATSSVINYPQSLDWRVLGDKILIAYYESTDRFELADKVNAQYLRKVNAAFNILSPQSKQPLHPESIHLTGWEY